MMMRSSAARALTDSPITRSATIAAAFALLDEQGIERLTLRRLGERLAIDPEHLRSQFARRRMLIETMAAELAQAADAPVIPRDTWQDNMRRRAGAKRRAMLSRRDGALLMLRGNALHHRDDAACLRKLIADGFASDTARDMIDLIDRFTLGWALSEQAGSAPIGDEDRRFADQLAIVIDALQPRAAIPAVEAAPSRRDVIQVRLAAMVRHTRESADIAFARTTRIIELDRRLLLLLDAHGDLPASRIAISLGADKAQVSRSVRRLREMALVAREDVRGAVRLTDAAREPTERLNRLAHVHNCELVFGIDDRALADFLADVRDVTARAILLLDRERRLATMGDQSEPGDDAGETLSLRGAMMVDQSRVLPPLTTLLSYTNRSAMLAFRRVAGLASFEACVLMAIGKSARLAWPALVETMGRDQSQVARTSLSLIDMGLVEREGGLTRRSGSFRLTAEGMRKHALLDTLARERDEFLMQALAGERLRNFAAVFEAIEHNAAAQLSREQAVRAAERAV